MEQTNSVESHEKVLTLLHRKYHEGLILLKRREFQEGCSVLLEILKHFAIKDSDLDNLRYSIFMSLAEVKELVKDEMTALGFYWQALQILEKKMDQSMKGQPNARQQQQRPEEEFTLLLKMIFIGEKVNLGDQLIYLLKKAIKISPSIWRQKLLLKLKDAYQSQGKMEYLNDLTHLMQNKEELDKILNEKCVQEGSSKSENSYSEITTSEEVQNFIEKVTIYINLDQKDEIFLKYSCWETLFTVSYVLLKCQNNRNFNKKKYLHKKYDQNNKDWMRFLKEFSLTRTRIEIVFTDKEEEPIEAQIQTEPNWGKMILEIASELLKYKYFKKKSKKPSNPLEELTRLPSLNSKDPKKVITAQTKSIFTSLKEYYKEQFAKNHFNQSCLNHIKFFEQEKFLDIFAEFFKDDAEQMKPQNDEDEIEMSYSMIEGLSEGQKDNSKEKKPLKVRKMQLITHQKLISSNIPLILCSVNQNHVLFQNIVEMIEEITQKLLNFDTLQEIKTLILGSIGVRSILEKNILKILQKGEGFFSQTNELRFLDLLIEKLQQLIEKDTKVKVFKQYQDEKKEILINFIKERFTPSTFLIKESLGSELQLNQLKKFSHICFSLVKINSLFGMIKPTQIEYYRQLFIIFKTKEEANISGSSNIEDIERKVKYLMEKQIEKFQKKASNRLRILTIQDEKDETSNSVDQIYKKDQQISAVLPLLKVFNCHPQQLKQKSQEPIQQTNGKVLLQTFIKLAEIFFKKISIESSKQFNVRLLTLLNDIMKIKQVINQLYNKFTDNLTFKNTNVPLDVQYHALLYLLKIYLLNLPEDNDYSIKIAFLIVYYLVKDQPQDDKYYLIPKMICMLDDLIKYKKNKVELAYSVRRRFYQNFILKNLSYIYNSPLFVIEEKDSRKSKKMIKSASEQESNKMVPEEKSIQIIEEKQAIKEKVFDILHDIYFCPEKQRQFTPKKIDQAVGYFMYLLRGYHQMFQRTVIELQNQALKIYKKSYKLFIEKKDDILKTSQLFKEKARQLKAILIRDDNSSKKEELLQIAKLNMEICREKHGFYIYSLFVIGKFYEAQFAQPQLCQSVQTWLQEIQKDEQYFFEYLVFSMNKQAAWENIIRVNCTKTFFYFDSLLNKPFEPFKQKFNTTKKMIHFALEHLSTFTDLVSKGMTNLEILNILKIKQREYLMIQKEIECGGIPSKQSRQLQRKFYEGMKKIHSSSFQSMDDVRAKYLRWSQIKCKIFRKNIQKQQKEQKVQEPTVIIELDEDECNQTLIHQPSKNIQQLLELIEQAKSMLADIPIQSTDENHLLHLNEDITMETYNLISRIIQQKLMKIIQNICQSINIPPQNMNKKMKEIQFLISDLNYLLKVVSNGQFMTSNAKYKFIDSSLEVSQEDFSKISSTFQQIFLFSEKQKNEKIVEEQIVEKEPAINEQPNELGQIQEVIEEVSAVKSQKKSNEQVKEKKPSKILSLDLNTFIFDKIVGFVKENKFQNLDMSNLHAILSSYIFQQVVLKANKIMNEMVRIFIDLPKHQVKKQKNRRSVVLSLLYCSHLAIAYAKAPNRANQLVKQYYTFKTDEFTTVNLLNEKINAEKNQLLSDFYNRVIVHHIMRIHFIREVFQIFKAQGNKQSFMMLIRKLLKLVKASEPKVEKQKKEKQKDKEKEKEKEKNPGVEVINVELEDETKKNLQKKSEPKEVKDPKESNQKDLESITNFNLFCEGTLKFMQLLMKDSQTKQFEQKYEKALLEFKNKIKKKVGDQKNIYLQQIQKFLQEYQLKYEKKIKLKKTKKDKQLQNMQKNEQMAMDIEKIANAPFVAQIKPEILQGGMKNVEKIAEIELKQHLKFTKVIDIDEIEMKERKEDEQKMIPQQKESIEKILTKKEGKKKETETKSKEKDKKIEKKQRIPRVIMKKKTQEKEKKMDIEENFKKFIPVLSQPFIVEFNSRNKPIEIKDSSQESSTKKKQKQPEKANESEKPKVEEKQKQKSAPKKEQKSQQKPKQTQKQQKRRRAPQKNEKITEWISKQKKGKK